MTELAILITMLLFSLCLVLGVVSKIKKIQGAWIYFTLSVLCLLTAVLVIVFSKSGSMLTNQDKVPAPIVKPAKDPGQEHPPQNNPTPYKDPKADPGTSPPPVKPPAPSDKIVFSDDEKVVYKVVKGDTLWSISVRSGVSVEKIKQWNDLNSNVIYVGQAITLYGKNVEPIIPTPPPKEPSMLVSNGNVQKKEIALTFDAGSDAAGIKILDVLKKHHIKATFFLTGKWVQMFPDYAKRIVQEGHELGNHTYSHPDALKTTSTTFVQDILKAEEIIKIVTGKSPRPYFRFPYGSYDAAALKAVGEAGYSLSIQWSLDTLDWKQPSAEDIISRIEHGASNGDIILMHIGGINTPEAVDQVIPLLQAKGYKLVTLSELLK